MPILFSTLFHTFFQQPTDRPTKATHISSLPELKNQNHGYGDHWTRQFPVFLHLCIGCISFIIFYLMLFETDEPIKVVQSWVSSYSNSNIFYCLKSQVNFYGFLYETLRLFSASKQFQKITYHVWIQPTKVFFISIFHCMPL